MMDTQRSIKRRRRFHLAPLVLVAAIGCCGVNGQGTIGIGVGSASNTTNLPMPVQFATAAPSPGVVVTSSPTRAPVVAPTDFPTTLSPTTSTPTSNPTGRPTTVAPTSFPTSRPTSAPTSRPTVSPTSRPTAQPTLAPTGRPTTSPTISPAPTTLTKSPTISPRPTPFPTRSPTDAPVLPPSLPPTMGTQQSVVDVVVRLNSMPGELPEGSVEMEYFEQVTRDYLLFATSRLSPTPDIRAINVNIFAQDLVSRRRLQTATTATTNALQTLRIGFDVILAHREIGSDPKDWISQAFDTLPEQDLYISRLKARSMATFQTVESIGLRVDGRIVGVTTGVVGPPTSPPAEGKDRTFWIIVIAAGGGGMALLLGVILILSLTRQRSRKNVKPSGKQSKTSATRPPHSVSVDPSQMELAAEIHLQQRQDDISTLGDPMGGMHLGTGAPRDERTASVGHDYDYAKHFLSGAGRQNSMDSQNDFSQPSKMSTALGPMDHTLQDEESLDRRYAGVPLDKEERLEFEVPAGKLGMVIDTPDGHSPLVHAIKPGSVLDGKVQVGDFLVQVNHQDVTEWTAVKVSKYISALSGRARLLVFHRTTRRRTESSVFFEDGSV